MPPRKATSKAPRKPRAPREIPSVDTVSEVEQQPVKRDVLLGQPVRLAEPTVDPDIEAAKVAKAAPSLARPWAQDEEEAPKPKRRRTVTDDETEVSRIAKRLMNQEAALLDRIYSARAELGKKPGARRELEEARVALQAMRGFEPNTIDQTGLPEGVKREPGFVYRWVARTDSFGREDPRRNKVQQWKAYGGEVVKDAAGQDVDEHYGVLMKIPFEGRAQREAESAPAGAAKLSSMSGQIEEDVAKWRNSAGQQYARLTGEGGQVVSE